MSKAFRVLSWMAEQPSDRMGVRKIAAALDLQPSTTSRILAALSVEGLVRKDPRGGYTLGLELVRLGVLASRKLDIKSAAQLVMKSISDACDETVILAVYDHDRRQMLRVDQIMSPHPLRYVIDLGSWTEIFRGASGLGILAFLPPDEREIVLQEAEAAASDAEPWLRRDALDQELATIRQRGYAHTRGRRLRHAVALSAPIFDLNQVVTGDLIISIPESRYGDHRTEDIAKLVVEGAASITTAIGGQRPAVLR